MSEPVKWNIHPGKGTWLVCYVWDTIEELRDLAASKEVEKAWDAHACYIGDDWRFHVSKKGKTTLKSRKLGEVHFFLDAIGAGVVAHELQHFISHWVDVMDWDVGDKHFEPVSRLVGDLTNQFWNAFYDRFTLVQDSNA